MRLKYALAEAVIYILIRGCVTLNYDHCTNVWNYVVI